MKRVCIALLLLIHGSSAALAAELAGVSLPEKVEVAGRSLLLNGLGLREATVFKVDVYVAGLYLEKKSNNPSEIMNDRGNKQLILHFVRDVGVDKIRSGWLDGFKNNGAPAELEQTIQAFNAAMTDISEGQKMVLSFVGDTVLLEFAGSSPKEFQGAGFQKALLAIWLGPKPPNDDLKKGLLGS